MASHINSKGRKYKKRHLIKRDGECCIYCRKKEVKLSLDHVYPQKYGGSNKLTNLALACIRCNSKKRDLLLTEFIKKYNIQITKQIAEFL